MDAFHLTATGRIGKVHGLRTDKFGRSYYRFSMATNRMVGSAQQTLWLQVSVPEPLCLIVSERGCYVGENVLIMTDFAELTAIYHMGSAKAWLNVTAQQLIWLSNERAPALEHSQLFNDRSDNVIDYNLLMKIKSQRTERVG